MGRLGFHLNRLSTTGLAISDRPWCGYHPGQLCPDDRAHSRKHPESRACSPFPASDAQDYNRTLPVSHACCPSPASAGPARFLGTDSGHSRLRQIQKQAGRSGDRNNLRVHARIPWCVVALSRSSDDAGSSTQLYNVHCSGTFHSTPPPKGAEEGRLHAALEKSCPRVKPRDLLRPAASQV